MPVPCYIKNRRQIYNQRLSLHRVFRVRIDLVVAIQAASLANLGRLYHLQSLVDLGATEVLPAIEDPRDTTDDDDDGKDDDAVVHVGASDGELGREDEQDGGDDNISDANLLGTVLVDF